MAVNYSTWSVEKLNKEIEKIQRAIQSQEKRNKKDTLAKVVAMAKANGFELNELVEKKAAVPRAKKATVAKTVKTRGKVKPKYKNPQDPKQTWTGRGRQPVWVREHVAAGGTLEDVTI